MEIFKGLYSTGTLDFIEVIGVLTREKPMQMWETSAVIQNNSVVLQNLLWQYTFEATRGDPIVVSVDAPQVRQKGLRAYFRRNPNVDEVTLITGHAPRMGDELQSVFVVGHHIEALHHMVRGVFDQADVDEDAEVVAEAKIVETEGLEDPEDTEEW